MSTAATNFWSKVTGTSKSVTGTSSIDTLVGSAGSDVVFGGVGNDIVSGGAGSDLFVVSKGAGSDTILDFTAGASGDVLRLQGYGFKTFSAVQSAAKQVGADTVVTLASGETLTLKNVVASTLTADNVSLDYIPTTTGAATKWLSNNVAASTLSGTSGNDQLTTTAARMTLSGGSGDDTYCVANLDTKIVEKTGGGIDTVKAWGEQGYSLLKAGATENLKLMGGDGQAALGNALDNYFVGSSTDNIFQGGKGNDYFIGGGGRDTYILARGDGSDVIADFVATGVAHDVVSLTGYDFKTYADVAAALKQVGTDTVLNLGNGETLTFKNTTASSFTAGDFLLPETTTGWVKTFSDDFSTFSRYTQNGGTWMTKYVFGGDAAYTLACNGEQQVYVDQAFKGLTATQSKTALGLDPFSIADGQLTITAAPVSSSISAYTGTATHTSGVITTEATFVQTYGHFEISAKLASGAGAWSAFWMLSVNGGTAEIDILESFGNQTDAAHVGVHSATSSQADGSWVLSGSDLTASFHSYGVTWTPYDIIFYLDGVQVARYATPTDMNSPMYLLANLAMGGTWAGTASSTQTSSFVIDSITAYQLAEYTLAGYTLKTSATPTATITGTSGVDCLKGTDGADKLVGNGGLDTLYGGYGDDTYVVTVAGTKTVENFDSGVDTVLSSVAHTLQANIENLTLTGTAANYATGNALANIITGNSAANVVTGGLAGDILTGGGGADTFVINAGDGSDIITDFTTSGSAHDVVKLVGLDFNTIAEVKSAMTQVGSDVYFQLNSFDTLVFRNTTIDSFTADDFAFPNAPVTTAASTNWIIGTTSDTTLVGASANETFQGAAPTTTYYGGKGDDFFYIYSKTQTVVEKASEGVDTAVSYVNAYTLPEYVENLSMMVAGTGTGNGWSNVVTGSSGKDVIDGKGGNDWLTGGAGNDIFVHAAGDGYDTITDFHVYTTAAAEHDTLKFSGYGSDATLTHDGDIWTIKSATATDTFRIAGVTALAATDYVFV